CVPDRLTTSTGAVHRNKAAGIEEAALPLEFPRTESAQRGRGSNSFADPPEWGSPPLGIGIGFSFLFVPSPGLGAVIITRREKAEAIAKDICSIIKIGQGECVLYSRLWSRGKVRIKAIAALAAMEPVFDGRIRNCFVAIET